MKKIFKRIPRKKKKAINKLNFPEWMISENPIVLKTSRRSGKTWMQFNSI